MKNDIKKIAVFDVPASSGGAMTILKDFYNEALARKSVQWYFIVSTDEIKSEGNVTVIKYPWIKRSWLHRMAFDYLYAFRTIRKFNVDEVFSLQNTVVKRCKKQQVLYVHQPIPFTDIKYRICDGVVYWAYQNIISKVIYTSIKQSRHTIVQTQWMKSAILKKTGVKDAKVSVIPPYYCFDNYLMYADNEENRKVFFYPVAPNAYKNHGIIIEAVQKLISMEITDFQVIFTTKKTEYLDGFNITMLPQIKCIGTITHEEVMDWFSKSTLIFPSKLETFGLPLLEAASVKAPVLAGDMPFSHEILDEYPNVKFFDVEDADTLVELMRLSMEGKLKYHNNVDKYLKKIRNTISGWQPIMDILGVENEKR